MKTGRIVVAVLLIAVFLIILYPALGSLFLSPTDKKPAPDFTLKSLEGKTFSLKDYRGKVVVLDFMATWCGPCQIQIPHLQAIQQKYGGQIVLFSIDIDPNESESKLRAFVGKYPDATWIWALDKANLGDAYKVSSIPTLVIVDKDGVVRFRHVGVTDASTLAQNIDELLG